MTLTKKILAINDIRNAVAGVMLDSHGVEHHVLQMTVGRQQALEKNDSVEKAIEALREVAPTLSDDEIARLNGEQLKAILMLAVAGVEIVEKAFPNAVRSQTPPTSPA